MKNNLKVKYVITLILLLVLIIGSSFAYWQLFLIQDSEGLVTTGCFDIDFVDNNDFINLLGSYPISDMDGMEEDPYTFTLTNTCNVSASYKVIFNNMPSSTLDNSLVKIGFNDRISLLSAFEKNNTDSIIFEGALGANEVVTHDFRMWIDSSATLENSMNKKIVGKIKVNAVAKNFTTLGDKLANLPTNEVNVNGNLVNKVYGTKSTRLTMNNYVWFSGHLWQVMEVNDDSIKLISSMPLTSIAYGSNSTWDSSWVKKWLDNEFYETLTNKNMILDTKFCLDSVEESDVTSAVVSGSGGRTLREVTDHVKINTCSNEIISKVGLMTFEDYVYSYDGVTPNYTDANYLSTGDVLWSMTPFSNNHMWITWFDTNMEYITVHNNKDLLSVTNEYGIGVKPVISIPTSSVVLNGSGKFSEPYVLLNEYELNKDESVSFLKVGDYVYLDESNNPNAFVTDNINSDLILNTTKDKVRYRVVKINEDGSVKVQRSSILRKLPSNISTNSDNYVPFYYKYGEISDDNCAYAGGAWHALGCRENNIFNPDLSLGSEEYNYTDGENIGYLLNNTTNGIYTWYSDSTKAFIKESEWILDTSGHGKDYSDLNDSSSNVFPYITNDGVVTANIGLPIWGEMFSGNDLNAGYWLLNRRAGYADGITQVTSAGYANSVYPSSTYTGVRIVTNLKPSVLINDGSGTIREPYTLYMK